MKKVRRIIRETTLDYFAREMMDHIKNHPDATIESHASLYEREGCVWFTIVLLYEREESE